MKKCRETEDSAAQREGIQSPQQSKKELKRETQRERQVKGQEALWAVTLLLIPLLRTLLALGCHVGMADEKAEDNLKKTKLPKT